MSNAISKLVCLMFAALLFAGMSAKAQESDRATIVILDASGSMWGQLPEGRTKIEVARDVLAGFLGSRDLSVPLGVVVFGHHRKGDCSDIEVVAPVGGQSAAELSARLNRISPKGKTPLGQSLRIAAAEIPRTAEAADIVLVTDGLETCDVDPCAVAEALASEGVKIRAHVVGFGLSEVEAEALACVPEKTGGLLMRPQTGAELAEALALTTADAPAERATGVRLIFSYPGTMPDVYEWALRNDETGKELVLGKVSGDARYKPFAVELAPGPYTAIVTASGGRGETKFAAGADAKDVVVTMQGILPVTVMQDRGPYAARGETVAIDLSITQAGQEQGGAALALRLYSEDGGDAITYSTIEGQAGAKQAGINLPASPGRYLLRLESWGGDLVEEMMLLAETDPEVILSAPPTVAPGEVIVIESTGSQLWNDGIEIWQGDRQVDWGLTLGDLAYGNQLHAPTEPGTYDLVYRSYDAAGERIEKARQQIDVGTVVDDATGAGQAENGSAPGGDDGHGPDGGVSPITGQEAGKAWADYPHRCLPGDRTVENCDMRDAATSLSFHLPENWVADVTPSTPYPSAEFAQKAGAAHSIWLNPVDWPMGERGCRLTRVGQLCADPDRSDKELERTMRTLQFTLTTGKVLRRCGDEPCEFGFKGSPVNGRLPARWSSEFGETGTDGRVRSWFWDLDPAGNFKLVGLNQEGGDDCLEVEPGSQLCAFTPYISSQEFDLIRNTLRLGAEPQKAGNGSTAKQLLDLLAPSRRPAP
ncbi:vWA domain-containing protein [Cohaesibacter haloalkalitolerans]|uniref:vWA domain-containing protein n=1 Tax=Cohaesibacter haloalkalitolerans TaxID=1162980 RepID=UPI000E648833|nr:VWA domain-containing protein [Cohaesibacter haloalkalitolerans]